VFEAAGGDFYKVDAMLFSPARVLVTALDSGRTFAGGRLAPELLARSFGGPA
jgi:methenyltetrahydromethanopterin cyclohydrolase